ncbi:hypothetical protein MBLNU13_g00096t1 [Cladosporium sp. NU13]
MSNLGSTNEHGQGASHATQSSVPGKVQEKAPASVEAIQEGVPEKLEKILPNKIHDTAGAKFSDGSVGK